MRDFVRFIATAATVMHLTFGCCLDPIHHGGGDACCGDVVDACDACGLEPHAEHAPARPCDDGHDEHEPGDDVITVATVTGMHACDGCSCVATEPDGSPHVMGSPLPCGRSGIARSDAMSGATAASLRRRSPGANFQGQRRLGALFERCLI